MEGNKNLTLALVWQMMRAYTLSLLAQVTILHFWRIIVSSGKDIKKGYFNLLILIVRIGTGDGLVKIPMSSWLIVKSFKVL